MIVRAIAGATLRRIGRDRTSVFFMFALPILIITVIGSTMAGDDEFVVGVHDEGAGELGAAILADLERADDLEVRRVGDLDDLRAAVRRSELVAGVVLPAGLDERARTGESVAVEVLSQPASGSGLGAVQAIRAVVAERSAVLGAAAFAAEVAGGAVDDHLDAAAEAAGSAPALVVETTVEGESRFLPTGFTYSTATMLVLFVFVNAVAGGADLVQHREQGLHERMLAAPVTPRAVIAGEAVTYLLIALLQSALIVGVGALLFGVRWGDPVAAAALVGMWAVVAAGAGMLLGSLLRTVEQATAIGPVVGIAMAMLGGCMWPLEIVPPLMQAIGHAVPHGWAVDGWIELLSRDGGLADIGRNLLALGAFALAFGGISAHRLRRQLAG